MAGTKLTDAEVRERIIEAYHNRYERTPPMKQEEYVKWAKEKYGDKSEQTYCNYFTRAREIVNERWDQKLDGLLTPAIEELGSLLTNQDARIRQKAVDQIVEYAGRKIKKVETDITSEGKSLQIKFGGDETTFTEE